MKRTATSIGIGLVGLLFAGSTVAAADDAPVTAALEWTVGEGAEDCQTEAEIKSEVEARLRRRVFVPHAEADVVLRARLSRSASSSGYDVVLELSTRDGRRFGRRTLHTEEQSCEALDDSLTLVVALLLDAPREELEREAGGPLTQPPPPPPPRVEPEPSAAPAPAPRPEPWRFSASVLGAGTLELLPQAAVGVVARFGAKPPRFVAFDAEAAMWANARAARGPRGATFSLTTLGLHLCPLAAEGGRLRLEACLGQHFGWIESQGFGLDRTSEERRFVYNLSGRTSLSVVVAAPLALRLGLGVEAPLLRDDYFFTAADGERTSLFRMGAILGRAEAGLGIDW